MAIGEPSALANAGELLANAPGGVRTVIDVGDDSRHERKDGRCSRYDKRKRGALARRLLELVRDQQTYTKSDCSLGKRNNSRDGKVVAKLVE